MEATAIVTELVNEIDLTGITAEQEAALHRKFMREQAEIKVREKIENDVIRNVFSEFKNDFRNLDWKEPFNVIRPGDGKELHFTNNFCVSYKVEQALKLLIKVKRKDGKLKKITFADHDGIKDDTKFLLDFIKQAR